MISIFPEKKSTASRSDVTGMICIFSQRHLIYRVSISLEVIVMKRILGLLLMMGMMVENIANFPRPTFFAWDATDAHTNRNSSFH